MDEALPLHGVRKGALTPLSKCPAIEWGPKAYPGRDRRIAEVGSLYRVCSSDLRWLGFDQRRLCLKMFSQPICLELALSPNEKSLGFLCCFCLALLRAALLWWKVFTSKDLLEFSYLSSILKFIIFSCFQRSWSSFLKPPPSLGRGFWGRHQFRRPRLGMEMDWKESFFRGASHSYIHMTNVISRDEILWILVLTFLIWKS